MNVTKRVLKNLLGDTDKDKVNNMMDCKVKNPKKHGGDWFRQADDQPRISERTRTMNTTMERRELEEQRRRKALGSSRELY